MIETDIQLNWKLKHIWYKSNITNTFKGKGKGAHFVMPAETKQQRRKKCDTTTSTTTHPHQCSWDIFYIQTNESTKSQLND